MYKVIVIVCSLLFTIPAFALDGILEWTNQAPYGVIIERGKNSLGPFTEVFRNDTSITTWTDKTVNLGETWCYRVAYHVGTVKGLRYAGPVCKTWLLEDVPTEIRIQP